jgi:hypothetical protein
VIVILLFSGFAAIAWLRFGRPRATAGARQPIARSLNWQAGQGERAPRESVRRASPVAPDDNPEFLQQLRRDINRDKPRDDPDKPAG